LERVNSSSSPVVLIVEDRRATRYMIRNVLQDEGYQVIEADNGKEALDIFMSYQPSVVAMDIVMPIMDGLTACRQLKKLPGGESTPVIMFTGVDEGKSVEDAFEAGANDFITKPINWEELRHRIRRLFHLRNMEEALQYQAYYDSLTGLPNRLLLMDRLTVALNHAQKDGHKMAVFYINIRNFKLFNDAFGYDKGDELLKEVASRMEEAAYEEATVSRLDGDDFGILLPVVRQDDEVAKIAQDILQVFRQPRVIGGQEVNINCNLGISFFPDDGSDAQELLRNAETAMFQSSKEYNRFRFYNQQMNQWSLGRLTLENSLHHALEREEFALYYQPQVDINNETIVGVEALLRWEHPQRGLVSPMDFIPLAEETGLIIPIGEWVLRQACHQCKAWQHERGVGNFSVAVNLSAVQFRQENLVEMICRVLKETDLDPGSLRLEITESVAMQDVEFTIDVLKKLKDEGIAFSIDDFGTGYSSLGYLKRLPIDELKIDRSFVRDVTEDPDDAVIVETIFLMGQKLGLKIVAEGVETEEHLDFLRKQNGMVAQGYYFSKPQPAEDLENWFDQKQFA